MSRTIWISWWKRCAVLKFNDSIIDARLGLLIKLSHDFATFLSCTIFSNRTFYSDTYFNTPQLIIRQSHYFSMMTFELNWLNQILIHLFIFSVLYYEHLKLSFSCSLKICISNISPKRSSSPSWSSP